MANAQALLDAGFEPISAWVICPICQQKLPSTEDFAHHPEHNHIYTGGDHLRRLQGSFTAHDLPYTGFNTWKRESLPDSQYIRQIQLDCCTELRSERLTHHIKLLRTTECLHMHRLAILKLWPEFGYHPVFDDLKPTKS